MLVLLFCIIDTNSVQTPALIVPLQNLISIDIKIFDMTSFNSTFSPKIPVRTGPSNWKSVFSAYTEIYVNDGMNFKKVDLDTHDNMTYLVEGSPEPFHLETYLEFYGIDRSGNTSAAITYDPVDVDVIEKSFRTVVTPIGATQSTLIFDHFVKCLSLYKRNIFYAPVTPICQSSGFGKTRLVQECGTMLPMIYGVFRFTTDNGYPRQPRWIIKFYDFIVESRLDDFSTTQLDFECLESNVGRALLFIESLIVAYNAWFDELIASPAALEIADEVDRIKFVYSSIALKFKTDEGNAQFGERLIIQSHTNGILRRVSNVMRSIVSITTLFHQRSTRVFMKDQGMQESDLQNLPPMPFLIVLDEIANLLECEFQVRLNPIFTIRRALHLISTDAYFLCVNIGTSSDISRFHRTVEDRSLRYSVRPNLLMPLILSCNSNIFSDEIRYHEIPITSRFIKDRRFLLLLCTFGRPLWSSLRLESIFNIAQTKILNGKPSKYVPAIAIWSIRTGLTVNCNLQIAKDLLNSHMATLLHISYDTESMYISYPSEPILALTAREILRSSEHFSTEQFFMYLLEYIQGRPIDRGRITESIFAQLLLIAVENSTNLASTNFDEGLTFTQEFLEKVLGTRSFVLENLGNQQELNLFRSSNPRNFITRISDTAFYSNYHITSVKHFLESIFGAAEFETFKSFLPKSTLDGFVNASHFVQLKRKFPFDKVYGAAELESIDTNELPEAGNLNKQCNIIDRALLRNGFIRQCGYTMPPSYYGIDFIIPVLIPRKRGVDTRRTRTSSRTSARTTDTIDAHRTRINSSDMFTFIAVQIKAISSNLNLITSKMMAKDHYVACPHHSSCPENCGYRTDPDELEQIYRNQLSLVLSSSTSYVIPDKTKRSSKFRSEGPHHKVARTSNSKGTQVCILSPEMNVFADSRLVSSNVCELASRIIDYDHEPFSAIDELQLPIVSDGVLNNQYAMFSETESLFRIDRDIQQLPKPLKNFENFTPPKVNQLIQKYTDKHHKPSKSLDRNRN